MELVGAGFHNVIRDALSFVRRLGARRGDLELFHGLDGNSESQIARIALGAGAVSGMPST